MLFTRETNLETTQIYIKKWEDGPEGPSSERLLTHFPHPHPSIKDLQKEVIRSCPVLCPLPHWRHTFDLMHFTGGLFSHCWPGVTCYSNHTHIYTSRHAVALLFVLCSALAFAIMSSLRTSEGITTQG